MKRKQRQDDDDQRKARMAAGLRLAGLGNAEIAALLGDSAARITRLLRNVDEQATADSTGPFSPSVDGSAALARYAWLEQVVAVELLRLERNPRARTIDKMRCVQELLAICDARVQLRYGAAPTETASGVNGLNANDIRARLMRDGLVRQEELVSPGEREWLGWPPEDSGQNNEGNPA